MQAIKHIIMVFVHSSSYLFRAHDIKINVTVMSTCLIVGLVMIRSLKTSDHDQTYYERCRHKINRIMHKQCNAMKPHESGMLPLGFRLRLKRLGLAPMKLIVYLRRTGFWPFKSHSTSSTHLGGGILLPGLKLSTSFLEIW